MLVAHETRLFCTNYSHRMIADLRIFTYVHRAKKGIRASIKTQIIFIYRIIYFTADDILSKVINQ